VFDAPERPPAYPKDILGKKSVGTSFSRAESHGAEICGVLEKNVSPQYLRS